MILANCCHNCCPKCGSSELKWQGMSSSDNGRVISNNATCKKCGTPLTEFFQYRNTEFPVDNVDIKEIFHKITYNVGAYTFILSLYKQDGSGKWLIGTVISDLAIEPPFGTVTDESPDEEQSREDMNSMMTGIEQLIISLAMNNVDISNEHIRLSIREALERCSIRTGTSLLKEAPKNR